MAAFAAICVSLFGTDVALFPFPWGCAAVGAACCIAGLVAPGHAGLAESVLGCRPVTYIGRISYSLYLWHWPVIVLLRWTIGIESAAAIAAAVLITGLLACVVPPCRKAVSIVRVVSWPWTQLVVASDRSSMSNRRVLLALPMNFVLIVLGIGAIALSSALPFAN